MHEDAVSQVESHMPISAPCKPRNAQPARPARKNRVDDVEHRWVQEWKYRYSITKLKI